MRVDQASAPTEEGVAILSVATMTQIICKEEKCGPIEMEDAWRVFLDGLVARGLRGGQPLPAGCSLSQFGQLFALLSTSLPHPRQGRNVMGLLSLGLDNTPAVRFLSRQDAAIRGHGECRPILGC